MEFAVPEGFLDRAEELLDIYLDDKIGLDVLQEFYTHLPDAREEWIREILIVSRHQGIFLLSAMTGVKTGYLYLVSSEGIEFQGQLTDGYLAQDVLDFFQFEDEESFQKVCSSPDTLEVYEPVQCTMDICPACHSASGELHELGCPVEICPWCGGQLVHCNCRFEQLGLDALTTEEELVRFEELLEMRGRIPYSEEQRPSFADEGPGVLFE